jgi:hypothetical protein
MLLLRVTSDPALRGRPTDDGFTIGIVSSETLFLFGVTTFLGLVAALVYAAGRAWFPPVWRPWVAGVFFGLFGGADLVSTEGIDFRILEPLWLAIVMFVAIPTVGGVVIALWVERWLGSDRQPRSRLTALWPLVAFLALGPFGVALLLLLFVGWGIAKMFPAFAEIWRSEPVAWIGRTLVALGMLSGAIELFRDSVVILGRSTS